MRGWAFGVLRLSRRDFYEMRPGEFWEAMRAYQEEVMGDRRHLGELVRGATLMLFNLQLKPSDRFKDPAKFWRMPWDEESQSNDDRSEIQRLAGLSQEEKEAEAKKFLERITGNR